MSVAGKAVRERWIGLALAQADGVLWDVITDAFVGKLTYSWSRVEHRRSSCAPSCTVEVNYLNMLQSLLLTVCLDGLTGSLRYLLGIAVLDLLAVCELRFCPQSICLPKRIRFP